MNPEGQTFLERCLLLPSDATARKAFADWLQEHDDPELAEQLRGDRGEELLCITRGLANRLGRFPDQRFLWGVVFVFQAEQDRRAAEYERRADDMAQNGMMMIHGPDRRGWFRRLFGG